MSINLKKEDTMAFGDYYVAEISWFPGNPVYRTIVMERNIKIGSFDILTGSEYPKYRQDINKLHIFKLIEKIPSMKRQCELDHKKGSLIDISLAKSKKYDYSYLFNSYSYDDGCLGVNPNW